MIVVLFTVLINSILLATVIFKCAKKRVDTTAPENSNASSLASTKKMTDTQKAQVQEEFDAAIEAEKKAAEENAKPIPTVNTDGTLPISLKKPISDGQSKGDVKPPVVWSADHEEVVNKESKYAAETKKPEMNENALKSTAVTK